MQVINNLLESHGSDFAFGIREPLLFHNEMEERKKWILAQNIPFIAPEECYKEHWVLYKFKTYEDAFAFQLKFRGTARGRKRVEARFVG